MTQASLEPRPQGLSAESDGVWAYSILACLTTWLLALPAATAWLREEAPSALAVACAGLSAFGPLLATLAVVTRAQRREVFGRWRTNPGWVVLSLLAPLAIHTLARGLYAALGGEPVNWLHPPVQPEALAALIVFPLGEEFGWRGFAYPRMAQRLGVVRGSLLLGALWGFWHLGYGITPQKAGFDLLEFSLGMLELPLYSLLIAWVMERANRSMAVALAFHAGGHLDHIERTPSAGLMLHACHVLVLAIIAVFAARALAKGDSGARVPRAGGRGAACG